MLFLHSPLCLRTIHYITLEHPLIGMMIQTCVFLTFSNKDIVLCWYPAMLPSRVMKRQTLLLSGARCSSVVRAFAHGSMGRRIDLHGVDPLSYFSFQSVLYDWCNKGRGMYYPVYGVMHMKEPLLLIGKSSPCGGSGFPLSLSE